MSGPNQGGSGQGPGHGPGHDGGGEQGGGQGGGSGGTRGTGADSSTGALLGGVLAIIAAIITVIGARAEWIPVAIGLGVVTLVATAFGLTLRYLPHLTHGAASPGPWFTAFADGAKWLSVGASGTALVCLVAMAVADGAGGTGERCGPPLELRAAVASDAVAALRQSAAEFVTGTADDGCPRYHVEVTPEPGPAQATAGFTSPWEQNETPVGAQMFGPQPDLWMPATKGEKDAVAWRQDPRPGDVADGLVSSPMVIAVFPAEHRRVYRPGAWPNTPALVKALEEAGVRMIARPLPESSAAALAVTETLYKARHPASYRDTEKFLSPSGWLAPDAASLLCRIRGQAAEGKDPPEGLAVVVPEHLLNDYLWGRPLGDRCAAHRGRNWPYPRWRLYPLYASDLPSLTYPSVQIRWGGQDDRPRDEAVRALHRWLREHPLTAQGFRDAQGLFPATPGADYAHPYLNGLDQWVGSGVVPPTALHAEAPRPGAALDVLRASRGKLSISLAADVSGSMGEPASAQQSGSRLARAAGLLQNVVTQLNEGDDVALSAFSRAGGRDAPHEVIASGLATAEQRRKVTDGLRAQIPSGKDLPLTSAIARAPVTDDTGRLVVVSDGQSERPLPAADRRALEELRERRPKLRLTLVPTGPTGCGTAPLPEIVEVMGGSCAALTGEPDAVQAARLLAGMR
ncbi:vWA domain-containing protein [Actinomadura hibisca]|uniref:vWA domain-containing protein n=1 Tax=Actinomadura hibisca TaxID=68565 RepID=UPI000830B0B4|nr:vWA domain-containing protein [Actinomadura hibisca]